MVSLGRQGSNNKGTVFCSCTIHCYSLYINSIFGLHIIQPFNQTISLLQIKKFEMCFMNATYVIHVQVRLQQACPIKEPLASELKILIIPMNECPRGWKCLLRFNIGLELFICFEIDKKTKPLLKM